MGLRRDLHIVLACLVGTSVLFFIVDSPSASAQEEMALSPQEELAQIDEEIKKLEDLRDRRLSAAARAEDQGMRWQFMQNQKQEAKRAFQRADDNRQAAKELQERIDALKKRRTYLVEDHKEADAHKKSP